MVKSLEEKKKMTDEKRLMIQGMDMLMTKINKYADNKSFTVAEIIKMSNEVYAEIMDGKTEYPF